MFKNTSRYSAGHGLRTRLEIPVTKTIIGRLRWLQQHQKFLNYVSIILKDYLVTYDLQVGFKRKHSTNLQCWPCVMVKFDFCTLSSA